MTKNFMFKILIIILLLSNISVARATAKAVFEGNTLTDEGAWCWFADPRALHYENNNGTINNTYIGYIDVHGNIKATQHDFLTGKTAEVLIRSYFQPDDHNNPSFLVLPDERIMIFYSRHTDEACFYYRISKKPGDITSLGEEKRIATADNTTYPSPFILTSDPNHIYLCWRGINWHPTVGRLTLPDASDEVNFDWGPFQMIQSTGARPYCKYYSNGNDKIYLTYTTGHPDNEYPNFVYFNYIDIKTLQIKDIKGTVLSTIANGVHNVNKTSYQSSYPYAVVDSPSDQRDWVWQTVLDKDGFPVIALVQISNDKLTHNYYYAKWTGSAWRKTFLANGGGKFHQSSGLELCYSGGLAIDDSNPDIVYCSVPVAGNSGSVYEIKKITLDSNGSIISTEQITTNSAKNNVRPYVVANSGNSPLRLVWMNGDYYDWIVSSTRTQGFPTSIRCDYTLPTDNKDITKGLIINENFNGTISGTAHTQNGVLVSTNDTYADFQVQNNTTFSVSITPYIYEGSYYGNILKIGNLTYGLNKSTYKPFVAINNKTSNSTNVLGNSDVWKTQARATGGVWWEPSKLKYFNLTLTYENGILKIYRNGLIDQVIEIENFNLNEITLGGFNGWIEDCRIYNRTLNQGEIKMLTEISLAYTFDSNLLTEIELENLKVPQNITTDILLPAKSSSGNTVTWTTNNSNLISVSGLVTLPKTITPVQLTAVINGKSKTFNVSVLPRNIENNKMIAYNFELTDFYTSNGIRMVKDKSGNENDAIIYGNSQVNGSLDLRANTASGFANNGYATAPDGILNALRSFTFLAKINPVNLASQPRIFDFGSASGNSLLLRANAFTAGLKYNNGTTTLINSTTQLATGQESKVAMTFDAKTKVTKIYLNGTETASASTFAYEPYQLSLISSNTRNYIGRTQWWDTSVASSNIDFCGTIDDFFLYDIVLTPTEIVQVQNNSNTGFENIKRVNYSVFPNPVTKNNSFKLNDENSLFEMKDLRAQIVNSTGQTIQSYQSITYPFQFNGLSATGLYFIRLTSENYNLPETKLIVR